ncbi:CBS domain-containing protein [Alteribacillus persepolensis]|uniref:CBS domain-containing protein n=1 Tax=Alteribacillus persepolensis TaxID=568899 RepID=A0A1G7YC19_9BACI|nr:CBS domain-containing protein [Alteribacillus persepolensis]SDG93907.1 CBS domain-containing protein [Alteribacillus persepolensis]
MSSIQNVMTTDVETCRPDETISDAAMKMKQYHVGAIPVTQEDNLMGMITDRDIVVRCIAEQKPESTPVSEVMSSQIITAEPDMDIHQAAKMMAEKQIRRLPIVENQRLVGIASLGDLAVDKQTDAEASFALSEISERPEVHH